MTTTSRAFIRFIPASSAPQPVDCGGGAGPAGDISVEKIKAESGKVERYTRSKTGAKRC